MGNKSTQLILKLTWQLVGLALLNCIEVLPLKAQVVDSFFNIPPEDINRVSGQLQVDSVTNLDGLLVIGAFPDSSPFDEGIFSELPLPTACTPGTKAANSEFVFIGRGGIAPNPLEALQLSVIEPDWVELSSQPENSCKSRLSNFDTPQPTPQIVEAQGWIRDKNGEVILVADAMMVTPHSSWQTGGNCDGN